MIVSAFTASISEHRWLREKLGKACKGNGRFTSQSNTISSTKFNFTVLKSSYGAGKLWTLKVTAAWRRSVALSNSKNRVCLG
jgi:hypothetical protein